MATPDAGGADAAWARARDPVPIRALVRSALGLVAILVVVLASLALLNSFFVDLAQGQPAPTPGGDDEEDEPRGEDPTCEAYERLFFWIFIVFLVTAVALFAIGVWRRDLHGGRIGNTVWGILAVVAAFLAVLAFGAWRVLRAICTGALDCGVANDSTYSSFLFLLAVTLASMGLGIFLSHRQRRNFLGTGWGLLGLLMFLPTVLTGFAWFTLRTICTPELSCAARDDFLAGLASVFWFSLIGTGAAIGIGVFVQRRFAHGIMKSGWGVVAIALGFLALLAAGGWLFVDSLYLPACDPPPEVDEPPEIELRTCEEIRDHLQNLVGRAILVLLVAALAAGALGMVLNRRDMRAFWSSPWAIVAYILLGALLLMGIGWLLVGTMCDESGESGEGTGQPGGGGTGAGPGTGGGGGGTGDVNPQIPSISIDPSALTWLLVALLVVAGIAALLVLLRFRAERTRGAGGGALLAEERVQAAGRKDVLALLAKGAFAGADQVIAAYRAFLGWSAARGLAIAPHETAREHAGRVAHTYAVPPDAMREFITAYEIARLSTHAPSAAQQEQAVRFARGLPEKKGVDPG